MHVLIIPGIYFKKKQNQNEPKQPILMVFLSNISILFPKEMVDFITADASWWAVQEKSQDFSIP